MERILKKSPPINKVDFRRKKLTNIKKVSAVCGSSIVAYSCTDLLQFVNVEFMRSRDLLLEGHYGLKWRHGLPSACKQNHIIYKWIQNLWSYNHWYAHQYSPLRECICMFCGRVWFVWAWLQICHPCEVMWRLRCISHLDFRSCICHLHMSRLCFLADRSFLHQIQCSHEIVTLLGKIYPRLSKFQPIPSIT